MSEAKVAIIGGSGLYKMEEITEIEEARVSTPFGKPSDTILVGNFQGMRVAFLPRHGVGHRISPSELPAKANIYALKSLGVERIVSVSAVGSLKEEIAPLDLVIPDQLIDCTKGRDSTFFTGGIVAHVSLAEPFCPVLRRNLSEAANKAGARVHETATCVVVEGPQLSTKAESQLYRSWGADVIGMTASPEVKLAREAEICYATLAIVTDYDCWHPSYETATAAMILANLQKGVETVRRVLRNLLPSITEQRDCACGRALKDAIATVKKYIPDERKKELWLLVGKYIAKEEDVTQA